MTRDQARTVLLIVDPVVPALWAKGQEDWRYPHRLSEDVREFGWDSAEQLPEVIGMLDRLQQIPAV